MKTQSFGKAKNGAQATLYCFENAAGMVMEVTDFGATLYALKVPDKNGQPRDVVLGYDSPMEYLSGSNTAFGATIGRNGNRIGEARFELNGKTYQMDQNEKGNNLHSGFDYYHYRMWNAKASTDNSITFSLHSPDGDQGFPGNFDIDVTYTLTDDGELRIDYCGVPDHDTVANMTNHSYFNLNGHDSGSILEHEVWVDADAFLATDADQIPTGEIVPVAGTPMDFRTKKPIGRDIGADDDQMKIAGGYDHNWCLNNHGVFAKVASLFSGESGITMDVCTDRPGVQIYTANYLREEPGKGGAVYKTHQGICFETQGYPDAIHHSNFPSVICRAGEPYQTTTVYRFRVEKSGLNRLCID